MAIFDFTWWRKFFKAPPPVRVNTVRTETRKPVLRSNNPGFASLEAEQRAWEGIPLPADIDHALWVGSIMSMPNQGITRREPGKPWEQ